MSDFAAFVRVFDGEIVEQTDKRELIPTAKKQGTIQDFTCLVPWRVSPSDCGWGKLSYLECIPPRSCHR
jgi:hypothetical protein